jgi:hypothetical protein|tara:strand:+ start:759 stop:971 length:213 start_codon:yes stop_codon:yes gene_type:complete
VSGSDLSSIKWENDGEMSAQDTWNLVRQLSKTEEHDRASALLHLSSKHRHSKVKPRYREATLKSDDDAIR